MSTLAEFWAKQPEPGVDRTIAGALTRLRVALEAETMRGMSDPLWEAFETLDDLETLWLKI